MSGVELRSGVFLAPQAERLFLYCVMTSGMPPVLLHVGSKRPQSTAGKAIGATWSDGKTRIRQINGYSYGDSVGTQELSCAAAQTNTNWTAAAVI